MCSYTSSELHQQMCKVIFGVLILFYCLWTYFVVCGFSRTITTCVCLFSVYENYFVVYVYMLELVIEKPTSGMLVKSLLYGDVSEKPRKGMIYPFSAGTSTFVRTIETFVEIFCHRFFSFGEDD
jgi:hypothetical protein